MAYTTNNCDYYRTFQSIVRRYKNCGVISDEFVDYITNYITDPYVSVVDSLKMFVDCLLDAVKRVNKADFYATLSKRDAKHIDELSNFALALVNLARDIAYATLIVIERNSQQFGDAFDTKQLDDAYNTVQRVKIVRDGLACVNRLLM